MPQQKVPGRSLAKSPVLWLLTATLTACGGGGTPAPGGSASNKLPEVAVRGDDGRALTADSYLASGQTLTLNVSDLDGSVKKVSYVIDRGSANERGGELTPAGKMALPLPALAGGTHTLSVSATDNAGGVGKAEMTFRVDAAAPTITGVTLNDKALASGTATNLTVGDAATVTASAQDTRGDTPATFAPVTLRILEGTQVRASGGGEVSADLSKKADGSARSAGPVTFTVEARDSVGFVTSGSFTLNFAAAVNGEITAPILTWLAPAGEFISGNSTVALRATATRNGQDVTGSITYSATCGTITGQSWTLGADCADSSKQVLTATIEDGGKRYSIDRTVTVDASAPNAQIISPTQAQIFTSAPVRVSVQAQDIGSGVASVRVYARPATGKEELVGTLSASGSLNWYPEQTNSTAYELRAEITDRAGNTSTSTLVSGVKLQTASTITPQDVTVNAPAAPPRGQKASQDGRDYVRGPLEVKASAITSAASGFKSAELLVDGDVIAAETQGAGATSLNSTFNFDFDTLNDGLHDVAVRFTDNIGTVSARKLSVFVDRTAPVVKWNTPASGAATNQPLILQTTASDAASGLNGTVTYSVNGQPVTSPWTPGSDGTFAVTASATDNVGNTGMQNTTVTYDKTSPVITATSPTDTQEFSAAPITISATATDNLTGVVSMEAAIGLQGEAPFTLGLQKGASYSTTFTPAKAGTYVIVFTARDAAGNQASVVTRTLTYNVTTPPVEKAPAPILSVVGGSPYIGNMSVNVSGTFDTNSQIDRLILQITDTKGVVDNTTYITSQAQASFSVDTTKFANGDLKLQVIAYTKTGLRGTSDLTTVQVKNVINPVVAVASPSNGATVTTPTVPVRVTITKSGDTAFTFSPASVSLDLMDYRGQLIQQKKAACTPSTDASTYTCDTSFDIAGLPADTYILRAMAQVVVDGASSNPQTLTTESRFTSNTISVNPPAATISFPTAVTLTSGTRIPARIDSGSGFFATVSDDKGIQYVEARLVGPYAEGNIETDGTRQCQASGSILPGESEINVLVLNVPGAGNLPYTPQDIFIPKLDVDGSTYVPDSKPGQRYDMRVTTADSEGNRNIQCVPVQVERNLIRPSYAVSNATTPSAPSTAPGELTYTSGTWYLDNVPANSRVAAVFYANGKQVGTNFIARTTGSRLVVSQTFSDVGTYEVKWLIEDMLPTLTASTGVVTTQDGGYINVARNPAPR
jgi:hypothetical protein